MTQYSKEFREQALKLSDEIGLKKVADSWELNMEHWPIGGRFVKGKTKFRL